MTKLKYISSLLVLIFIGTIASATGDEIISSTEFVKIIKSDKVIIIDASKSDDYQKMHIRNAINVPHMELYKEGEIKGLLKEKEELASYFGKKGVDPQKTIIIYDDGSHKYASRVYWALKYLGADNLKILHKNLDEWRKSRVPVTRIPSKVAQAGFKPSIDLSIIADIKHIKENKDRDDFILIDSRTAEEYKGISTKEKSKGHIPGAILIDYKEVLDESGAFKSKEELSVLASKYGLSPDKEIVLYCVTSVRAAVNYVAFKEILGFPKVKIYDGAYNEWVADSSNPIEK